MLSEIRKLDDSDFDDFVEIWCRAYPGTYDTATEEMKHRIKERWVKSNKESQVENFYGAFRNNKLLGGMILFNHRMNIHSIITPIGGVGQVCVDSLHKKEQVGKDLMSFSLQHFYERGICLTTLYPFSSEFYAKMGYGLGSKVHQYRFEPKG
ncbi:MAG: GNAT family N-acetyltransferase, partial [Promethearchaeota archaeon]